MFNSSCLRLPSEIQQLPADPAELHWPCKLELLPALERDDVVLRCQWCGYDANDFDSSLTFHDKDYNLKLW